MAQITATFDYEMGAAIIAIISAIEEGEMCGTRNVFDNEYDREHVIAFAGALKARFDVMEAMG